MNAVYAAVRCKVKHLVFLGSESVYSVLGKKCGPLDAKYAIEQYIKGTGVDLVSYFQFVYLIKYLFIYLFILFEFYWLIDYLFIYLFISISINLI